ncbi:PREDICTED: TNF receptor-associated factor 2-like isoform X1 [Acropora digitifera]|uniref:TNF receptor-associated factor 2-like isoform X1 n=2 Tax=Acropora digitifera TaxID=70779 RepID=UPI00077A48F8|nr:PREDICTED: TNF receptor-associated factor 2-like isoform X1 [Acropora digitifera]
MPGYRLQLRGGEIDPRYICVHCGLLLKNPFLTRCGHFYCQSCLELLFRNPKEIIYCKLDGMKLEKALEDLNTRAEIMQFVVLCPFHCQGCKWVGKVKHFEFHQGMCVFFLGSSHNMDSNRPYKSEHVAQDSKHKLVDSSPSDRDNLMDGEGVDVGSISDDSITLVKRCPFHLQGCPWVGEVRHHQIHVTREHQSIYEGIDLCNDHSRQFINPRRQIHEETERHLQEMLRLHSERITALERKLGLLNTSGGSSGASSQRNPDDERISVSADIERRVTDPGNKAADHEVLIVENNHIAMESSRETANLRRQLDNVQESARRLEQRMESIEHALALRNVTLADLEENVKKQDFRVTTVS